MTTSTQQKAKVPFDEWSSLAIDDPEAFEQKRNKFINQYIDSLPEEAQHRMRQLQWRIDTVRNLSSTPMSACLKIYNMMWDSVVGEHGMVEKLHHFAKISDPGELAHAPKQKAEILPFHN